VKPDLWVPMMLFGFGQIADIPQSWATHRIN
jgi:hypothetical protein